MHHLRHHQDKVSFEQCTSTLFAHVSPRRRTCVLDPALPAHTSQGCTQGPRADQIHMFARINSAVGECDLLTLLVTDEYCVSKSVCKASESSLQQQRYAEYAKCPY